MDFNHYTLSLSSKVLGVEEWVWVKMINEILLKCLFSLVQDLKLLDFFLFLEFEWVTAVKYTQVYSFALSGHTCFVEKADWGCIV